MVAIIQSMFHDGVIVRTPVGTRIDLWAALGSLSAHVMKVDSLSDNIDNCGKVFHKGNAPDTDFNFQSKPETRAGREGNK